MRNEKPLIIHATHHKCGTHWFGGIMTDIAKKFNLKIQICKQEELRKDTDIWFFCDMDWKIIDFRRLNRPYVGTHMIRDPRDKVVSAYFYHLWCNEPWIRKKNKELGISQQTWIQCLNKEDGLFFEMLQLLDQLRYNKSQWNLKNKNILEIKYENVILNPEKWFPIIFRKWGFDERDLPKLMDIARKHHFINLAKRKLGEEKKKSHLRQGRPGDWKNHLTPKLKKLFKDIFGNWLIKLGYEKDKKW